eukprot:NODE_85_length_22232_cov_1.318619.p14 type:complete len:196 gc:universal NODE_85_length_22232_cov_1.318619:20236-19649(-)
MGSSVYSSWIGILTAILGNIVISLALNLQKYAHLKLQETEVSNEYRYLDEPIWWAGLGLLIVGECGNFIAYSFASASIVAPLGTVALIANTVFAPFILKEAFRRKDLKGVLCAVIGAILVVISSKHNEQQIDAFLLMQCLFQTKFVIYFLVSLLVVGALVSFNEKIGPQFILVDLSIVGISGIFILFSWIYSSCN